MADAAKSARGAFTDIKSGSEKMGQEVGYSMGEARHGVMMLGEEFGVHLPRGLTTFIAGLGPVGAAMEAAFPFLAIALGATLLIEHLVKMHEEGQKLTEDQMKFGTAAQNAFNSLDQKLLQAGIHSDELRNDHMGALKKQLELIDRTSMAELVRSFEEVAKSADVVFGDLKKSWYEFGSGSAGAKHSLEEFKTQYEALSAKGDDKGASDLLHSKIERETKILALQKQAKDSLAGQSGKSGTDVEDQIKYAQALSGLKQMDAKWDESAVTSQQALVKALADQVQIEGKVSALKKLDSGNATKTVGKDIGKEQSEAAKAAADHTMKMGELSVAAEREAANVRLSVSRASAQERLASDTALENEEYEIQMRGNQQRMAALDKGGKDYQNQLKDMHNKAEELTAEHENRLAALQGKATEEQARKSVTDLEQSEREKINATQAGSAARLAAIDAALKEEQSKNLQDTSFYRELLTQRVELVRKSAEDEAKQKADAGKEAADNEEKMGMLALAAQREHQQLLDSTHRMTNQQRMAEEQANADAEFNLKNAAMSKVIADLDKNGKDYTSKLQQLQDKQKQLVQAHEDEVTAIKEKAEIARNTRILSAEQTATSQIASGLTKSIMGHQTWAAMVTSFGDQAAQGLIRNSLMILMQQDKERLGDAKKAASSAYATGESMGPAGIILGPVFAAAAFAGVMAFQDGGIVPGTGKGDHIPAMLEPGEGVVPGGVMDGLRSMARSGNMGGGKTYHAHVNPTYHLHALDTEGMEKMLNKHSDTINKHVSNTMRKMNR
jgi:hypothetical protein